jgi:group I intron endonuclease
MAGGIYTIRIQGSKKFYIGRTKNFKTRKADHLWLLRNKKHHCKHLQNAFNKYGSVDFVEEEQEDDKEKRIVLEQKWMDQYGPLGLLVNHQLKTNPEDMADKPWKKDRPRLAHNKGKPSPLRGTKRDDEVRKKISAAKKGKATQKLLDSLAENRKKIDFNKPRKPMSEEAKKKMIGNKNGIGKRSDAARAAISRGRKGIVFSEEHRAALSRAAKLRWQKAATKGLK